MARKKESGMDVVAAMPWPIGIATGLLAFFAIRYGFGWYFSNAGSPMLKGLGGQLSHGALAPIAWIVMLACWAAAAASDFRSRQRKHLLDAQTGMDSLTAMNWREFEMLVGEAFRRRGYGVEETGLGGADGGIDLILRKDGRTELVQCKQWRSRQVKASVVREMWGLAAHHHADAVKIVCVGDYTRDAEKFTAGKAIELINGTQLLELVRKVQTSPAPVREFRFRNADTTPTCPTCGATMQRRMARNTNRPFWGCSTYPKCRGTRDIASSPNP